ncbi:MAG: hypothetical protein OES09_13925 [Gammaproteobacteria bacterium]|nr:hypothetical protein [Gammaproteobacteria bacterium]
MTWLFKERKIFLIGTKRELLKCDESSYGGLPFYLFVLEKIQERITRVFTVSFRK